MLMSCKTCIREKRDLKIGQRYGQIGKEIQEVVNKIMELRKGI